MPSPTPTPIPTAGLPLAPRPPQIWHSPDPVLLDRAKNARVCGISRASDALRFHDEIYVGCYNGKLLRLNLQMRNVRSKTVAQSSVYVRGAGQDALAVSWVDDGAAMMGRLLFVRAKTLKPIVPHFMTDSTFLGVIDDRAYIDDWCCFGRADVYQPATIYSISLKDGTSSERLDFAPDPRAHPGPAQPLGQGELNYLIGSHFYVVVQDITYRYDLRNLRLPPARMRTYQRAMR